MMPTGRQKTSIFWEGNMNIKSFTGVFLVLVFSLITVLAFAAGESWVVIKDKNGVCKVIEAKEKTPATIAGPFKSKEDAEKAKAKECPKGTHSTTDKIKEKAQESVEKAKTAGDKIKDKIKEAIPVDKKK
jgi:hypothetical protein